MKKNIFSRRSFLKGAVVGAFLLLSSPAFPAELVKTGAEDLEDIKSGLSEDIKKDMKNEVVEDIKRDLSREGRLLLLNTHTGEKLDVVFRDAEGNYDPEALASINHIMRCHHNDEEIEIDVRVIEYLNTLDNKIGGGGNEIHIISGYRSKEYNDLLRKKSRRVAKYSFHTTGRAIDFRIPNIKTGKIRRTALRMAYGGVGYYPKRHFIHIDSGSFRYW